MKTNDDQTGGRPWRRVRSYRPPGPMTLLRLLWLRRWAGLRAFVQARRKNQAAAVKRHLAASRSAAERGDWRGAKADLVAASRTAFGQRTLRDHLHLAREQVRAATAQFVARTLAQDLQTARARKTSGTEPGGRPDLSVPGPFKPLVRAHDDLVACLKRLDQANRVDEDGLRCLAAPTRMVADLVAQLGAWALLLMLARLV